MRAHLRFFSKLKLTRLQNISSGLFFNSTSQEKQRYTVLLIVTAGEIMDINDAANAVRRAGKQPLSIVIVGVGLGSFSGE